METTRFTTIYEIPRANNCPKSTLQKEAEERVKENDLPVDAPVKENDLPVNAPVKENGLPVDAPAK